MSITVRLHPAEAFLNECVIHGKRLRLRHSKADALGQAMREAFAEIAPFLEQLVRDARLQERGAIAGEGSGLRRLLWLHHGPDHLLYGDDGEMHCHTCHVDFKRMAIIDIDRYFHPDGLPGIVSQAPSDATSEGHA